MGNQEEIIREVLDEIHASLEDPRGIISHQRRLAFSLSLGATFLIENYLKKVNVLKSGAKINHLWLKKKKENVKKIIEKQIIVPIGNLKEIDDILEFAYKIEKERNELAYGKPVSEKLLKNQINLFLELKKLIEHV